ncbi:hypothetical protein ACEZ3G_13695 [Maribacter algicola]|uniref:Uncharacterized protein n=1 Tax=Meishania litoralis TaxID=3434685 RepID=A0ACC7LLZ2_9FLAO
MKNKAIAVSAVLLIYHLLFALGCSKNNDLQTTDETEASCDVAGIIDKDIVGAWTGEIYFNSNSTAYPQTHNFKDNGTVLASGEGVPSLNGCWRVSGSNISYIGSINYNGSTIRASFQGRIITPDSIYGTHSGDNDESGTIWMVR